MGRSKERVPHRRKMVNTTVAFKMHKQWRDELGTTPNYAYEPMERKHLLLLAKSMIILLGSHLIILQKENLSN